MAAVATDTLSERLRTCTAEKLAKFDDLRSGKVQWCV
jgi:hypothetical protein